MMVSATAFFHQQSQWNFAFKNTTSDNCIGKASTSHIEICHDAIRRPIHALSIRMFNSLTLLDKTENKILASPHSRRASDSIQRSYLFSSIYVFEYFYFRSPPLISPEEQCDYVSIRNWRSSKFDLKTGWLRQRTKRISKVVFRVRE